MVDLVSLVCPACGSSFHIQEGQKSCFCSYCGTQIFVDDGSKTYTYVHKTVDEARIREADLTELLELKRMEAEEKKQQDQKKVAKTILLIAAWMYGIIILLRIITHIISAPVLADIIDSLAGLLALLVIIGFILYISSNSRSRRVDANSKQMKYQGEMYPYMVNEGAATKAEKEKPKAEAINPQAEAEKVKAEARKAETEAEARNPQAEAEKAKAEARKAEAEADKVRAEADIARSEAKKAEADAKVKKTKLITRLVIAALVTVFLLVLVGVGEGWF